MTILVTGAAGFIGSYVSAALLARGEQVIGVDNLNPYYDVALKEARLAALLADAGFAFQRLDLADRGALVEACGDAGIDRMVHLAAQAGVRHSLTRPFDYERANVAAHLEVLEFCRHQESFVHLVYASSSSVYGGNTKLPFSESDRVDTPVSLYAATKRSGELMSHTYSHLYRLPATGLRFFTVYGPWGRPDMAAWLFTKAILAGQPITVFNHGHMMRDFTYVDDITAGVIAVLDSPPVEVSDDVPHRLYNIGNNRSEKLMDFIAVLEDAIGIKAEMEFALLQPGDVKETYADISAIQRDTGFSPTTTIADGVPRFVDWYRTYHGN
ncbi:MAG: NAD-dependent epimerase/dehydratase family protein [Pseudomonadota bacterium]|nr:NAD-dependent epimerase/dehydratase family protein [Pseudomonadota bacterium]